MAVTVRSNLLAFAKGSVTREGTAGHSYVVPCSRLSIQESRHLFKHAVYFKLLLCKLIRGIVAVKQTSCKQKSTSSSG